MNDDFFALLMKFRKKTLTPVEFKCLEKIVAGIVRKKTMNSRLSDEDTEQILSDIWLKAYTTPFWIEGCGIESISGYFMTIVFSCVADFFRKDDAYLYKKTQNILKDSQAFTFGRDAMASDGPISDSEPIHWNIARWYPLEWNGLEITPVDDGQFIEYSTKALSFEDAVHIVAVNKKIISRPDRIFDDETLLYFKGVFHDIQRMFNKHPGLLAAQLKELLAQKFWIQSHGNTSLTYEDDMDGVTEERFSAADSVDDCSRQPSEIEISGEDIPEYYVEKKLENLIQSIEHGQSQLTPTHLWIIYAKMSAERGLTFVELAKELTKMPELKQFGKSRIQEMEKFTVEIFRKHGIEPSAYSAKVMTTVLKRYFSRKTGSGV
jgi:hypothetical protein